MIVYTREFCPNCDEIKCYLKKNKINFEERDVDFFKNKAKLVVRGLKELPVLNCGSKWIEFNDDMKNIIKDDLL